MKIGIVGPSDSVDKILRVIEAHYPFLDTVLYKKEKIDEVLEIMDECIHKTDGILFTGCAVQGKAEKYIKIDKPNEAVMRNDSSIMKAFWDIKSDEKQINRVSIDLVERELVNEIVDELGIEIEELYVMPYDSDKSENEYIKRHIELWENGKVDIIISAFGAIYNELKAKGLPIYRLNLTTPLIKSSIENLINKVKTNQIKANQIAIQILKIKNLKQNLISQYDDLIKKNTVERQLIEYVREVQGSIFQLGTDKYIIFSTRRTLEDKSVLSYFQKMIENFDSQGITIYSGIGFGNTGWNAEYNAKNALAMAEKALNATFYIIDENNKIKGPINGEDEVNYDLYVYDEKINEVAKEIGVSSTYLSKVLSIMEKKGEKNFSSDTLGHYLGITERSARRIIEKFINSGYAEVVTTTVNKGIGRPKKIVKIKL